MIPQRHQRKRTKGYRLPDGVVCVTRPGKWGNPYPTAFDFRCALVAIRDGKMMTSEREKHRGHIQAIYDRLDELRGKDLACFCKLGDPCHADVLIEFANR